MINTKLSEPCVLSDSKLVEHYSETRITWEERLGGSSRTLEIETYMTADELLRLVERLVANGQRA